MAYSVKIAAPPRQASAGKALAVVLPFLIVFWINIAHHTMFFDEVNAWGISAASPTLSKLFYYVHYEGHPWLWYFILWFPSRLTHDPVALKWVEAVFGTAILLLIGLVSPFNLRQRALILGSYFLVWEYTVMCRMYSVMLLLVLIYLLRRTRSSSGVVANCALLGLVGNTDMTGVLLSSALLIEYAWHSYFSAPVTERRATLRRLIPGVAVYAALIAFAVATLWPSKNISWQSSGHLGSLALAPRHMANAITNMIVSPWWPIAASFPRTFWRVSPDAPRRLMVLIPLVLFAYWKTFRKDRNLLVLMTSTLVLGMLFADVVYPGNVRNWGIAFISLIAGLWIQSAGKKPGEEGERSWSPWTYSLFGASVVAAGFALFGSWSHPFSRARDTAQWLERNVPANVPLLGEPDVSFASVAEELQRPVYFPECGCVDTFKLFAKDREDFPEEELASRLSRAVETLGTSQAVFLFYRPLVGEDLGPLQQAHLQVDLLASFSGADVLTENFYVYRVRKSS